MAKMNWDRINSQALMHRRGVDVYDPAAEFRRIANAPKPPRMERSLEGWQFLIRRTKPAKRPHVAHIWTGRDTVCRLYSTGGIRARSKYLICDDAQGFPICRMCRSKP